MGGYLAPTERELLLRLLVGMGRVDASTGIDDCWLWIGRLSAKGYGAVSMPGTGRHRPAHRWVWEAVNGPVPDDLVMDHRCRTRACVNPAHLEPASNRDNIVRGIGPTAVNAHASHCVNGHALNETNTYDRPDGKRDCLDCKRERARVANAKRDRGPHNGVKTHCKHGHEFTPENTYLNDGHRSCRACAREYQRQRKERLQAG